jgi:hypothetical protein
VYARLFLWRSGLAGGHLFGVKSGGVFVERVTGSFSRGYMSDTEFNMCRLTPVTGPEKAAAKSKHTKQWTSGALCCIS